MAHISFSIFFLTYLKTFYKEKKQNLTVYFIKKTNLMLVTLIVFFFFFLKKKGVTFIDFKINRIIIINMRIRKYILLYVKLV
jgi:hypothetical protein